MIARSFIAQRAINNDKVWGRTRRSDLARRCEAQQKPAATCEQFFRDQDSARLPRASVSFASIPLAVRFALHVKPNA